MTLIQILYNIIKFRRSLTDQIYLMTDKNNLIKKNQSMTIHLNLTFIEVNQLSGYKFHPKKISNCPAFFIYKITMQANTHRK